MEDQIQMLQMTRYYSQLQHLHISKKKKIKNIFTSKFLKSTQACTLHSTKSLHISFQHTMIKVFINQFKTGTFKQTFHISLLLLLLLFFTSFTVQGRHQRLERSISAGVKEPRICNWNFIFKKSYSRSLIFIL